jgi:hypothetical protein
VRAIEPVCVHVRQRSGQGYVLGSFVLPWL